jgi:hypothetical protein
MSCFKTAIYNRVCARVDKRVRPRVYSCVYDRVRGAVSWRVRGRFDDRAIEEVNR